MGAPPPVGPRRHHHGSHHGASFDARRRHLAALADWADRIKAGELPETAPPRPTGIERNLVVTVRDWLDPKHYLHDLTATDKRQPTVNANGPLYGATELSSNAMPVLDPVRDIKSVVTMPVREPEHTPTSALANPVFASSPYFGREQVWDSQVNAHSPTMDQEGRIYFTAQVRPPTEIPSYCEKDSPLRSAQLYPLTTRPEGFDQNSRQVTVYDPRTEKFTFIDTCFGTQHLNFAEDEANTLWFSNNTQGKNAVVGWVNTKNSGQLAMLRRRRAGARSWSIPTATAGATRAITSPASRLIRARIPAFHLDFTASP